MATFISSVYMCNNLDPEFGPEHFSYFIKGLWVTLLSYSIILSWNPKSGLDFPYLNQGSLNTIGQLIFCTVPGMSIRVFWVWSNSREDCIMWPEFKGVEHLLFLFMGSGNTLQWLLSRHMGLRNRKFKEEDFTFLK